ncbi:hypothetical protein RclHR1_20340001 [Rhizophagus clarus]|uniref:DUF6570 domain-containing protein n=1 Tax=Rhizophagus clarus TaxID=94130 RepID=A0A2Z6QVQ6_9GLOM|nr:hypothetical protein RclHR1_20340001 [Rhizophagus clarus]
MRKTMKSFGNADEHLNRQDEQLPKPTDEPFSRLNEQLPDNIYFLSKSDRKLLQKFCTEMNKLMYKICSACNKRFPSINLILGMYRQCYSNKNEVKKFFVANNIDLGDVPEELKGLTEIEKILISQTFPIVSVYYLCGDQYAYSGNIINFSQDVGEFVSRLSRHSSMLDTLVVCRQSAEGSMSFKDFTVRCDKIKQAFCWLKENNRYYSDIIIDDDILRTLPENSSINEYLPQIHDAENRL